MKRGPTYTIIVLLYLAVWCGTVFDPGFAAFSLPALGFYAGTAATFALSLLIGCEKGMKPAVVLGYVAVQLGLFHALNLLPIPHWTLWLIAMPVISHATYCLRWTGALLAGTAFLSLNLVELLSSGYTLEQALRTSLSYGIACLFTVVFTHITRQAIHAQQETDRLAKELEEANARLRASAERDRAHAALSERNRIARDIHDGLGHYLTTIAVQLEAARTLLPTDPAQAAATIARAERQSREALDEVRRSVRTLRSDAPPPDLRDSLAGLVAESGLAARFHIHGDPRPLPPAAVDALFRTAQEGLTNVRKHAGTKQVRVTLSYETPVTSLMIEDEGRGSGGSSGGFGLTGLRERLEAIGGRLHAANRPEGGFLLKAEIPTP
jgi:signal transduction histidine kinase